ncbi:plasmid replication protein, CyRepA1 family [Anabaena cylindrica UHCC 0172]|uniref:plasmid replication protein, CyRepA1 family n=1 Tax=Anabaena cylindrica TaxID=1165 RepID=UPI002B21548C|nr:plasmid replication protein, CyRepA1 family [Anabaena cylindrica]MEA5551674.1 plasmid replication protein, CyRepA1 family [Anabaena cylindrica UHCC 0172]
MIKITPVSKEKPCQMCGRTDYCKTGDNGSSWCVGYDGLNIKIGDTVNGYRANAISQEWMILNPVSEQGRKLTKAELEEKNELARIAKEEAIKAELPLSERHEDHLAIQSQLSLNEVHWTNLNDRGLPDHVIEAFGYRSIKPFQRLKGDFPENLPGYNPSRKSLTNKYGGILCPIWQNGKIAGFKIRLDDNDANESGHRYTSLSSQKFTSYHLYGEQPLAVLPGNTGEVWVTEGNEIKPVIVNQKFDKTVLGGARQWYKSPNHAAKYLTRIKEVYGSKIILSLDAGDVLNKQLHRDWIEEYKFFESQGFEVKFAWWEQITKDCNDVDELDNLDNINFICLKQFKKLIKTPNTKLVNLSQCKIIIQTPKTEPKKATKKQKSITQEWEQLRAKTATHNLTRKADLTVESGYLPSLKLSDIPSPLLGVSGNCGAGKTFFNSILLKEWNENVIQITHLNNLGKNTAPKYDLMHHSELKELGIGIGAYERLSITDISMAAKLDISAWLGNNRFILVLDEVEQVLKSIQLNKNLRGNSLRFKARFKLEWMIKNATYIICSDRDLCDETIEYIEQVRGEKFYLIRHTGKKGASKMPIKMVVNKDKSKVLQSLYADIKKGLKVLVACENRGDLTAIELELQKQGITDKELLTIHGENSNEKKIKDLIENIDNEYFNYRIFGYTSTLGTGISLEKTHFDKAYYFVSGDVLEASEIIQLMSRYRPDVNTTIWCNSITRQMEINPDNLLKDIQDNLKETKDLINNIDKFNYFIEEGIFINPLGEIPKEDIPWINHKLSILARLNASRANPSKSLHDELVKDGYTVILDDSECENNYLDAVHLANKEEIKTIGDETIAKSKTMNDEQFKNARLNPGGLNKEEQAQFKKTRLINELGIHETEVTTPLVALERTKGVVSGAKALKIVLGDKDTALAYDLKDLESNPDPFDRKYHALSWQYFHDLGFDKFLAEIKEDFSYSKDSELVIQIADKARESAAKFKRVIGIDISNKKSDCAIVGHLLDKLCILRQKPEKGKNKARIYKINMQHYDLLNNAVQHINKQERTLTMDKLVNSKIDQTMVAECAGVIRLAFEIADNPIDEYELITEMGEGKPKLVKKLIFNQLSEDEQARVRQTAKVAKELIEV